MDIIDNHIKLMWMNIFTYGNTTGNSDTSNYDHECINARLILKKKNSTSATPLLKELHWLPIAQRIDYKCALLCFKCIHGVAPHYLREIFNFYKPRRSLRSTEDSFVLETPKTKLKSFGDRAFSSYGPRIWNSLPKRIRDIDKIEIFKKQLKHHLFLKTLCEE